MLQSAFDKQHGVISIPATRVHTEWPQLTAAAGAEQLKNRCYATGCKKGGTHNIYTDFLQLSHPLFQVLYFHPQHPILTLSEIVLVTNF